NNNIEIINFQVFFYNFSIWSNSTSTGVSLPNMSTSTVNLYFSTSISFISPLWFVNGPLVTRTCSPNSTSTSTVFSDIPICFKMNLASSGNKGFGLEPAPADPTKPVTPGVFLTIYQDSSVIINSTNT